MDEIFINTIHLEYCFQTLAILIFYSTGRLVLQLLLTLQKRCCQSLLWTANNIKRFFLIIDCQAHKCLVSIGIIIYLSVPIPQAGRLTDKVQDLRRFWLSQLWVGNDLYPLQSLALESMVQWLERSLENLVRFQLITNVIIPLSSGTRRQENRSIKDKLRDLLYSCRDTKFLLSEPSKGKLVEVRGTGVKITKI